MTVSRLLAAAAVVLVLMLAGCSGAGGDAPVSGTADRVATPAEALDSPDDDAGADDAVAEEAAAGEEAAELEPEPDQAAGFAGAAGDATGPLPEQVSERSGDRIIREGTMTIEVADGQFSRAFRRVVDSARDLGGYLTDSTSETTADGGTAGSVTVRVPVERYEELLTQVGEVGTLRSQDVSSRDVTAEYTDLESRLRHLRAQEAFYLGLISDAETVQDAIAVKRELDGIQSQIEQAQGRLGVLEDRTSYSTLTVEIVEPGAEPVVALTDARPMLADYWRTARDGFVTVVGWLLVSGVSLSPLVVPLLLAAVAWRLARRRTGVPATVAADSD